MRTSTLLALSLAVVLSPAVVDRTASCRAAPLPPEWKVSEPYTFQNLAVFLIQGRDVHPGKRFLTLQEALAEKKIVVHETGSVNQLAVENVSADFEVFIQAGDIVKGGQQDRVLAYDLIVPPKSGKVPLASFCVEHGRWQGRGAEDAKLFSESSGQLPGKALRLAVSSARQQGQVWEKVKEQQDRLSKRLNKNVADPKSPSSLQLTLEDKDLQAQVNAYVAKLEKILGDKQDAIGVVLSINGKIEAAEVYGSAALFRKMWPKMLKAAAVDAFCEQQKGRRYELPDADEIATFLTSGTTGKRTETEVNNRVQVIRWENETSVSLETRDLAYKGAFIHRTVIGR
jgi:hypothetical protein